MAKEILTQKQLDCINNLNLKFPVNFNKPVRCISKLSISRLLHINNIPYAQVLSYNFTDAIITLKCNKSNEIYEKDAYDRKDYCTCSTCVSARRSKAAKDTWNKPGFKENQSIKQAEVWKDSDYREYQSVIQRKTHSSQEYKNKISSIIKDKYKSKEFRYRNIEKNAERLRNYPAKDELLLIEYLKKFNISYLWQYPILLKEYLGFDAIMDFYLPDLDIFINVNTDGFHKGFIDVIEKDNKLLKFFGKRLKILYSTNDIETFLKEVISQ